MMLNKAIEAIMKREAIKNNKDYAEKAIADVTQMFNAGWDGLEDGRVINVNGNIVAIKKGDSIIIQEMSDFFVNMGKLDGKVKRVIQTREVKEDAKEAGVAQAIITKYYTVPKM